MPATEAARDLPVARRVLGGLPAQTLADAVRACDPYTPLDPQADVALRQNLDALRGGNRLARVIRGITRSGGIPTLYFLSGHQGGGKTTELLQMRETLQRDSTAPHRVFVLDADRDLDRYDVEIEDILVALWAACLREDPGVSATVLTPLWSAQVQGHLADLVTNLPSALGEALTAVLGNLRLPGTDARHKLRVRLGSLTTTLIRGLNQAFDALSADNARNVVVLVDNLEKLSQGQPERVERLFIERMGALRELNAHMVITVPLYLCYASAGASLTALYGGETVVLPMVKVRQRVAQGGGDDTAGLTAMTALLERRVSPKLFEDGHDFLREVARRSGGCIRHALRMVQAAVNEHDEPPVTHGSLDRAAASLQADFERALPEPWLPVLRTVAETNRFPEACTPEIKRDLLRHLLVLEYQNGDPEPWYGVHPLVESGHKYRRHVAEAAPP